MNAKFIIALAALAALTAANATETVPQQDPRVTEVALCNRPSRLVITAADAWTGSRVRAAISEAGEKAKCATEGPLRGEWVLVGDKRSMLLGITRSGDGFAVLNTIPRYEMLGPVTTSVIEDKS